MAEESGQGEKVFDPTPQKLEEARAKGDIPRSMDVSAASAMVGLFVALSLSGADAALMSGRAMSHFLGRTDALMDVLLSGGGIDIALQWTSSVLSPFLPIFLLPFGCALASLFAQRAFAVSFDKVIPKFSRLNVLSNAKQKFGTSGLFEFLKSTVKVALITSVLVYLLLENQNQMIGVVNGNKYGVAALLSEILVKITLASCVIFSAIALIDLLWQRFDHARKLRMSYQDIKDEHKNTEGDPHAKQQRRQRGQDIATNRMLLEVPNADVVIVNPTHFAVALKWSRAQGTAPEVVAKGTDEIAASIREAAAESGVPIHSDPPTARAIHASIEIGQEVDPEHYRAVAAAINFAEKMRQKAKERGQA